MTTLKLLILLISLFASQHLLAQKTNIINPPKITDDEINLDGILDEEIWRETELATEFIQSMPYDGIPASEKTEIRVLYSEKFFYVGARAYDSQPDSIIANLFRRDGNEPSDWIYVNIDSYNDNRTAFTFAVNPVGVQKDILYYDDYREDILWDAVWDVKTKILNDGWVAEFKIPISQLRFTSSKAPQNWGINFQRRIARKGEISFWSRSPREEYAVVSKFGILEGIRISSQPVRLEIIPYISTGLTNDKSGSSVDPFYKLNDFKSNFGADIKYGITSDFTLTATINPDFGQVEADPAFINLTEFESYYGERRPFFLEGFEIFNFGGTTSQNTFKTHTNFYTRRIGRQPFASSMSKLINETDTLNLNYQSKKPLTKIAGAAKISGKTKNGLSVGVLYSHTLADSIDYSNSELRGSILGEPATHYLVGRVRKDLQKMDAQLGGFVTLVDRDLNDIYLKNYLHSSAYQAGLDDQYYWKNRNWGMSGILNISSVNGSENALLKTQTTSARYFNRLDSKGLSVDSSLTNMSGYFGEFSIGRYSGNGLRYSFTYSEMSPEYEINDIGFLERADYRAPHYHLEYLNINSRFFESYWLWADVNHAWNFDGDMIYNFYSLSGFFRLKNLWSIYSLLRFSGKFYNDRIARGGPTMRRPKDWFTYLKITTDDSRSQFFDVSSSFRSDAAGEVEFFIGAGLNYRPASNLSLRFAPTFRSSKNLDQYRDTDFYNLDNVKDYLFSNSNINILSAEFRADITFSSKLSLQTYLRPYYSSADFYNYKLFSKSRTFQSDVFESDYDHRFDQEYKSLQGNAVLRWEFKPGSTLFFVWQQERESDYSDLKADFTPLSGIYDTFKNNPSNVFLIKVSYRFGN